MFNIIKDPDVVDYWVKNRVKENLSNICKKLKPCTKNKNVKFLEVASFIEYLEIYDGFESPHMIQPSYPFLSILGFNASMPRCLGTSQEN